MAVTRRTLCLVLVICSWLVFEFCSARSALAQARSPQPAAQPAAQPATEKSPQPASSSQQDDKAPDEEWSVIYMGKTRVGYSRATVLSVKRDGQELIRSENETTMSIKRFGQELKMKISLTSEETLDGQLRTVECINDNPPRSHTKTTGKVVGNSLELTITNAGKSSQKSLVWDKENKSPAYQDRLLREKPLRINETREFKVFLPELNQVTTVTLTAKEPEEVTLFGGKQDKLERIDVTQSVLPGFVTKTWVDAAGHTVKSSTGGFFGSDMSTYRVERDEALKEIAGAELDIAMDTLIKIQPPIQRAHDSQQIVYEVTVKGHDPAKEFPSGDSQTVKSTGPETAELTVNRIVPQPAQPGQKLDAPAGFLEPNRFLQSDDGRVIKHAHAAAGDSTDPWKIALKMESYVQEKLAKKNFSTALATAAEVAGSLEGDCTEHAVLLAAMLRVKKIPSRVVVGFVYADSLAAFGGHMWTEAFINGHWIPLDATLGRGGIGGAHIKLADTGFQDDGPAPAASFLPILRVIGNTTLHVKTVTYRE